MDPQLSSCALWTCTSFYSGPRVIRIGLIQNPRNSNKTQNTAFLISTMWKDLYIVGKSAQFKEISWGNIWIKREPLYWMWKGVLYWHTMYLHVLPVSSTTLCSVQGRGGHASPRTAPRVDSGGKQLLLLLLLQLPITGCCFSVKNFQSRTHSLLLSVRFSLSLSCSSVCLSVRLSVCLSVSLPLSFSLSIARLSVSLSVSLSSLSVSLSLSLSHLSLCLSLSVSLRAG